MNLKAFVAALVAIIATPAQAAFVLQNLSEQGGAAPDGSVTSTATGFILAGGDNGPPSTPFYGGWFPGGMNTITLYTDVATEARTIRFDWRYQTFDGGGSNWDPAGYIVGNSFFQLSPWDVATASGTASFDVAVGQRFGFFVDPWDTINGRAQLEVSFLKANSGGVPEPASWAMMIAGFGLAGGALRWRVRGLPLAGQTAQA